MDSDRNPSPPPELLQHSQEFLPDRIGDSVFSKHWLFQTLLNIEKVIRENSSNDSSESATSEVIELDQKLEEDACTLWDMSTNADVGRFLQEFSIYDIFLTVIEKTKSPRLLEIVVGILGNMASFDDLCQAMSEHEALLKAIIPLTGSSDAPTVIQALRLIYTGVVNDNTADAWLTLLRADSSFMGNIKFIFSNSLNGEVLKGALQLLYYIFDREENACIQWATKEYTKSVTDAGKQLLSLFEFHIIDELWLLLNLMCQHDENIRAIAESFEELQPVYRSYLITMRDNEYSSLPPMGRVAAIAAYFTTLASLLESGHVNSDVFSKDEIFLGYLKSMYKAVTDIIDNGIVLEKEGETSTEEAMEESPVAANSEQTMRDDSEKLTNGGASASNRGKLTHSISLQEDDYNSLFILKESMTEFCSLIVPSVLEDEDSDD